MKNNKIHVVSISTDTKRIQVFSKFFFVIFLLNLLSLILGIPNVYGQKYPKQISFQKITKSMSKDFQNKRKLDIKKAKKKKWLLQFKGQGGRNIYFDGVNAQGFPKYKTTYTNLTAAATVGTNHVWPGGSTKYNLNGSSSYLNNRVAIWDEGGVRVNHQEFNNRVKQVDKPASLSEHSTFVMGTIMAAGVVADARGMSYNLNEALAFDWNDVNAEMIKAASTNNLLLSNHSYGSICGWNYNETLNRWEFYGQPGATEDQGFGYYDGTAQIYDSIAYNFPNYLIVKAAGNNRGETGPPIDSPYYRFDNTGNFVLAKRDPSISSNDSFKSISYETSAKNILTVGAVYEIPLGYKSPSNVIISNFSSWGPTNDGRIKPDLVADGVNLYSPTATSNQSYKFGNGTSFASPIICGSLLLLQELYGKLRPDQFMRSATLKGLAIHTANEAGIANGPDYIFGWGLLDIKSAANTLYESLSKNNSSSSNSLIFEKTLKNRKSDTFSIITSGVGNFNATICWTDIIGFVQNQNVLNNPTPLLVNDLDIRIEGNGKIYYPWILDPRNRNNPARTGINSLDNVEKINIYDAVPGTKYKIIVNHKNYLFRDTQAYSIIVSGVGGLILCSSTATDIQSVKIDSFSMNNIHLSKISTNNYLDRRDSVVNLLPNLSAHFYLKINSTTQLNTKFLKIYIDYNGNGEYDKGELVSINNRFNNFGELKDSIFLPSNLLVGNKLVMRLILRDSNVIDSFRFCGNYVLGETIDLTLYIVDPKNDLAINSIISPIDQSCASNNQFVTVSISNNGSNTQNNFPIQLTVFNLTTNQFVDSFTEWYSGFLYPLTNLDFTFQKKINLESGQQYILKLKVLLNEDQFINNNIIIDTIQIAAQPTIKGNAFAYQCVATNLTTLTINNPISNENYFWYNVNNSIYPIAIGTNSTLNTSQQIFKVVSGISFNAGLSNNRISRSGNYQTPGNNYIQLKVAVPLTIQSLKLYTRQSGIVNIILVKNLVIDPATNEYTYNTVSSRQIQVTASSPNPKSGYTDYDPTDTGRYYNLNLSIPEAGTYWLIGKCLNGASLFRNNNISNFSYPIGDTNLFAIIGNSATTDQNNFYYYFYDMNLHTLNCASKPSFVNAQPNPRPTLYFTDDTLYSSLNGNLQWFLNDNLLTTTHNVNYIIPLKSGNYKVVALNNNGCITSSENYPFIFKPIPYNSKQEIALNIYPTLVTSTFLYLEFKIIYAPDFAYQIINFEGQSLSDLITIPNARKQMIQIPNLPKGMYLLRFRANGQYFYERFLKQD